MKNKNKNKNIIPKSYGTPLSPELANSPLAKFIKTTDFSNLAKAGTAVVALGSIYQAAKSSGLIDKAIQAYNGTTNTTTQTENVPGVQVLN